MAAPPLALCLGAVAAAAIAVEDLRRRRFHAAWLAVFAVAAVAVSPLSPAATLGSGLGVGLTLAATWALVSLRRRRWVGFTREALGLGDVLLLLAMTPLLALPDLLRLIVAAAVASLAWAGLAWLSPKPPSRRWPPVSPGRRGGTIPFATVLLCAYAAALAAGLLPRPLPLPS